MKGVLRLITWGTVLFIVIGSQATCYNTKNHKSMADTLLVAAGAASSSTSSSGTSSSSTSSSSSSGGTTTYGPEISSWSTTSYLSSPVCFHTSVVYNGYVYAIGGFSSDSYTQSTVEYAKINSDGTLETIGTWPCTTLLSTAVSGHTSVVYNGYVYAIGGSNGTSNLSTVQYAKINSDGTLGTWSTTSSLSTAVCFHTSVVYNGYVYAIGGENSSWSSIRTVQYAKINSDGTLGTWSTTTSPSTGVYGQTSVVYNGYVYVIGGVRSGVTSTVEYAKINSDGTLGTWSTTSSLSTAVKYHTSVVYNGYVYAIGGLYGGSPISTVQYAKINSDGTLGTWSTTSSLPTAVTEHASVVYNGYVYVIGGYNSAATGTVRVGTFKAN